jgi:subtilisin family serine protease
MAVRIGIVDTGVDRQHKKFEQRELSGVGLRRRDDTYHFEPDFHDRDGHGTVMASLIVSICKDASIHVVRIAQENDDGVSVRVPEQVLATGIEWCVNQDIRIINVSYNIAGLAEGGGLHRVCQKAVESGTIIVAAYRKGEEMPVYPAAFPTVIGVRGRDDLKPGEVSVLSEENRDLFAWGGSNSIATAQVSAMVGRIHSVDDSLGLEAVFAHLMEVAVE